MQTFGEYVRTKLLEMSDKTYRDFSSKLMPTVDKETVIGVRMPLLRTLAKELFRDERKVEFLSALPHKHFEENNLHAFMVCEIKDFEECVEAVESFLPCVDNWSTCDSLRPKVFYKNAEKLLPYIRKWIKSSHPYTVRFGIEMLMLHFLDERFDEEYLRLVSAVKSEEYYVKMMVAWYFSTALAKQYDETLKVLKSGALDTWTHNKAITKAIESYRIPADRKESLKGFKVTNKRGNLN